MSSSCSSIDAAGVLFADLKFLGNLRKALVVGADFNKLLLSF
jgi:hypothetical protein